MTVINPFTLERVRADLARELVDAIVRRDAADEAAVRRKLDDLFNPKNTKETR